MATKIRLQRHGKKGKPVYHIVVADARAKRDGRFIEKLGNYDPNVNPASVELNFESALEWVRTGAQPTDTVRSILSREGVLLKSHLLNGVKKGAFTEEEGEKRFEAWLSGKQGEIQTAIDTVKAEQDAADSKIFAAEQAVNEKRAEEIAAKNAPEIVVEETPAVEVSEETKTEAAAEDTASEETPAAE